MTLRSRKNDSPRSMRGRRIVTGDTVAHPITTVTTQDEGEEEEVHLVGACSDDNYFLV